MRAENSLEAVGRFWETIVLSMIGETLESAKGNFITGGRIVDKGMTGKRMTAFRVEVWFRDWEDEEAKNNLKTRVDALMEECGVWSNESAFFSHDLAMMHSKEG